MGDGEKALLRLLPRRTDSLQLSIKAPGEKHGVSCAFTFFANYSTGQGLRSTVFRDQKFDAV